MAETRRDDQALGMNSPITRRDFLQGTSALVAGAAACSLPEEWDGGARAPSESAPYPPALDGMRGSNEPAYQVAHL
ncbi:MAG: twin-arginine translocation signal domain-containing protein, partial [Myxococcota bacterium]